MTLKEDLDWRVESYRQRQDIDYVSILKWANDIFARVEQEFREREDSQLNRRCCVTIHYRYDGLTLMTHNETKEYQFPKTKAYNSSQIHAIMDEVVNLARQQGLEVQYIPDNPVKYSTVTYPSWSFYYYPPKMV